MSQSTCHPERTEQQQHRSSGLASPIPWLKPHWTGLGHAWASCLRHARSSSDVGWAGSSPGRGVESYPTEPTGPTHCLDATPHQCLHSCLWWSYMLLNPFWTFHTMFCFNLVLSVEVWTDLFFRSISFSAENTEFKMHLPCTLLNFMWWKVNGPIPTVGLYFWFVIKMELRLKVLLLDFLWGV